MPNIAPTVAGRVTSLQGAASVRGLDGTLRPLHVGDLVLPGEMIVTATDAVVTIAPVDAAALPDTATHGADETSTAAAPASPDSADADLDRVISGINAPTSADYATAAGLAGGANGGLTPGLRVDRISEPVTPAGLALPVEEGGRREEPPHGSLPQNEQQALQPAPIGAESETIQAIEEGPAVNLNLSAPTGVGSAAVITVTHLPDVGVLLNADGTPVVAGSTLTPAQLTGLKYVPPADHDGTTPVGDFTYTVSDHGATATGTVAIDLGTTNDAPIAVADTAATTPNTPVTIPVLANDRDPNGDPLTVSSAALSDPRLGSVVVNPDGTITYTPGPGVTGPVTFTYTISDGHGGTGTALVTVDVAPPADPAPVANPDVGTVAEDTPATGNVLANDTDADGNTLHVSQFSIGGTTYAAGTIATLPGVGSLEINADGSYRFNPAATYHGPVPVATYTASDGNLSSDSTLTLTVTPVNHAPVANPDVASIPEDTSATGNVLGNDTDVDGDALHVSQFTVGGTTYAAGSVATLAGVGTLEIHADGAYTFNPAANYTGTVPVATYTATDGTLTSTSTLTLTVTPVNHPPVANPDVASATEAGGVANAIPGVNPTGHVLANDTDPDVGDTLSVSAVSGIGAGAVGSATAGHYGSLVLDADGSYSYTVDNSLGAVQSLRTAADTLTDTFNYTVRDAAGLTSSTTLTVTLHGANDAPIAVADTFSATQDVPVTVGAAAGVLANDTDVDAGDTKTVSGVAYGAAAGTVGTPLDGTYGQLTLHADGSYTYLADKPAAEALAAGQTATEQFGYTLTDAAGASSTATITVTVAGVDDAPIARPDTHTTLEDTPLNVDAAHGVLANDTDADNGSVLTVTQFSIAGDPTQHAAGSTAAIAGVGTLTLNADGSYGYVPAHDYNGPVPVATYTLSDGTLTATSTLTLAVTPVNDPPVLTLDADHSHNTVSVQAISGLYSTGVDNAGDALPISATDSHYTVVATPAGSGVTATTAELPYAAWLPSDAHSVWIGSSGNEATGLYQFQTNFTLQAGADPASVNLNFDLASDNSLRDILVNGVSTGYTSEVEFTDFVHVTLQGGSSAFASGVNTITFVVDNRDVGSPADSGPTGLRIENISGTVAVVGPDPIDHQGDYATTYIEGHPASITDSDVRVTDVDSPNMQSATVTLTNAQAGDQLQIGALPVGIAASLNAAGTAITLSGAASAASYENAIHAIQFDNTSVDPITGPDRQITVVVNDGSLDSNVATTTVHVVAVDNAPALDLDANDSTATGTGYAGSYIENGTPAHIVDIDRSITDVDSTTLHSVTVHIANVQDGDVLSVGALPAGLSSPYYDPTTGTLTVSGTASLADYQSVLGNITYSSTSDHPSTVTRDIDVSVNDGLTSSNVAVAHISVTPVNDAPSGTSQTVGIAENTDHVLARADFGYSDVDGNNFAAVTVDPSSAGTLSLNGSTISAPTAVSVAQLDSHDLVFHPTTGASGTGYASIGFQVQDDGGTANGGVDTDPTTRTLTIDVAAHAVSNGAGSDTVTGTGGSDVFAWTLADRGTAGAPPTDTITDFSVAAPSNGGDVLDLRDLLQGEAKAGTTAGNLQNYLDFDTTTNPGSTIIHVSSTGGFSAGYTPGAEDQRIVLQGVDVRSPGAFGLAPTATDSDVIHQLLQRGKLVADGA